MASAESEDIVHSEPALDADAVPPTKTEPFDGLHIDDAGHLNDAPRVVCTQCKLSCKHYCANCNIAFSHTPPMVQLPLPMDIIRHPHENLGKTTSTHARLVSPTQVEIVVAGPPRTPAERKALLDRYPDPSRVLLLFPSKDAKSLKDINPQDYDRAIVLDGTWKQGKAMANAMADLPFQHVRIEAHETLFWRFQRIDRTFLSTIECIYWFYRELFTAQSPAPSTTGNADASEYDGRYDNLLFYFRYNWQIIQDFYKARPGKKFTPRHAIADSYIQYDDSVDEPADSKSKRGHSELDDQDADPIRLAKNSKCE